MSSTHAEVRPVTVSHTLGWSGCPQRLQRRGLCRSRLRRPRYLLRDHRHPTRGYRSNSPARSHRRPHASSVSLQLAPVAPGSLAIGAHQATTGGAWSPPSSRQRRVSEGRLGNRSRRLLARGHHAPQVIVAIARARAGFLWARAPEVHVTPSSPSTAGAGTHHCTGFHQAWPEAQPRCGGILDSVQRPTGIVGPRARPAPDGRTEGGSQPTESSRSNRRLFLAPSLPRDNVTTRTAQCRQPNEPLYLTLDIGSRINAGPEPRPEAEARDERTLADVACRNWFF